MFWWKSRPGELSYNSSISNNLAEMINFPFQIPAWDSHILTLELFLSFDTSICSAPSIWNPLFSINFHSNSKGEGGGGDPSHCRAFDYTHADSDGFHDHLRDEYL